jgi:hypothetical protein
MKKISCMLLLALGCLAAHANNVNITNVSIVNGGSGNVKVKFDVSWDNSWRVNTGQNNYDGVWVFFKYRKKGTVEWLPLGLLGSNNSSPSNCTIYQTTNYDKVTYRGAMIYRSSNGFGTVNFTNIELGAYNLPYNIDVKAFAIEMVYIPRQRSIKIGDGNGASESTNAFHFNGGDNRYANVLYFDGIPYLMDIQTDANGFDDDYLNWENGKQLYLADSGFSYSSAPASRNKEWPVMASFWCMKYEISQGAYRDFLNTLTVQQQFTRTAAPTTAAAGTLAMVTSGTPVKTYIKIQVPSSGTTPAQYGCDANGDGVYNGVNDGEWEACGYLSYPDVAAYLAWSGLAPMTEILYERMCRGFTDGEVYEPIFGEFAWGTNQIIATPLTLANPNAANETISNMAASNEAGYANYANTSPKDVYSGGAPLRNGIFSSFSGADRITSGASFFGVMELSGNLQEVCITIGNRTGRLFKGNNGNGYLTAAGNASGSLYWPGNTTNTDLDQAAYCYTCEVTFGAGTIMRGGHFQSGDAFLRVSDRSQGAGSENRFAYRGGRGVLY